MMLSSALVAALGVTLPKVSGGTSPLVLIVMWGGLFGLTLGPLASQMAASRLRHVVVWSSVVFFNGLSTVVEGRFFMPDAVTAPVAQAMMYLITSLVGGVLITLLFAPRGDPLRPASPPQRPWYSWAWRFVVSAFSYLVFYYLFGVINYTLVTHPYYQERIAGLTVPPAQVVLMAEAIRAPMMVLALLPLVLTFRTTRRRLFVICGLLLAVIGAAPLLLANSLPMFLRVASAWEIFLQNFSTGAVIALLLASPAIEPAQDKRHAATISAG
jgi:hypothetical protein